VTLAQRSLADVRDRAAWLFPGGVNSPVRAFDAVGVEPVMLVSGRGAHVRDAQGRAYVDYIGGWGPAILGHAHPAVVEAVRSVVGNGFAFGTTNPLEVELAERIRARMPSLERLRFTSSGTEAVMSAIRVARAATGRELVVKFSGGYHGHSDGLLVEAGSGVATHGIPGSAGIPEAIAGLTIVLPFNDPTSVTQAFAAHAGRIAAVVIEPVAANIGVIPPQHGFLEHLRATCTADGALLIFDEVITGFRLGPGGAQARYGIRPDLTTLGKVIGGGMPIGAYGGRADVMRLVAPEGPVYQAGTLAGHPLAMAAGIATLDLLTEESYLRLESTSEALAAGLEAAAAQARRTVAVNRVGSLLTVFFRQGRPVHAADAYASDRAAFARFFRAMLAGGVLLPPSPFEAWFVALAHGESEIEETLDAVRRAFAS
jgi:glutamate-1-semialdehyde 2,1-aminomutase